MKESLNKIMDDLKELDKDISELLLQTFLLVTKFIIGWLLLFVSFGLGVFTLFAYAYTSSDILLISGIVVTLGVIYLYFRIIDHVHSEGHEIDSFRANIKVSFNDIEERYEQIKIEKEK